MNRFKLACCIALASAALLACQTEEAGSQEETVDFTSSGALAARQAACTQNYEEGARKGTGAEDYNSTMLWSVSPYLLLVPSTGTGYVQVNVDASHYDWLFYTTADVEIENVGGPEIAYHGPVEECPELNLVEYGVHHPETMLWQLVLRSEALSRRQFYIGLAATEHSNPEEAGHAGHMLDADFNEIDHASLDQGSPDHMGH